MLHNIIVAIANNNNNTRNIAAAPAVPAAAAPAPTVVLYEDHVRQVYLPLSPPLRYMLEMWAEALEDGQVGECDSTGDTILWEWCSRFDRQFYGKDQNCREYYKVGTWVPSGACASL
jgi:hypothetical protein